ncbi:MAG: alkaline phosphatase family protein [Povalibacter sp.]
MIRILLLLACTLTGTTSFAARVLVISIDGLHPAYVTQADRYGLKIPTLRKFMAQGSYAEGVVGVVPTVTYPNHTTLMTGVAPSVHGILSNTLFDPQNVNREGWYWYAEDIKSETLWKAANAAGLVTASVNWPVTVGDTNIRYLLPEYWRAQTSDDLKVLRALSRPEGLQAQMEKTLGPFIDGNTDSAGSDEIRTRFAVAMLREHRPDFMAVHLIELDGIEHHDGPFQTTAFATLERLDAMIAQIASAALTNDASTIVAVVSDHGFIATHTAVNLRSEFVTAGLIKLKTPTTPDTLPIVESWDAQVWNGGGSAAVVLREPKDASVRQRVADLLDRLKADPRNGIARVVSGPALLKLEGFSGAEFVVEFAPGFYFGSSWRGELLTPAPYKGTHGYLPDRAEMHAAFFIKGSGIAAGRNLGVIDMRQIAPTLAKTLNVAFLNSGATPLLVSP